MVIWMNLYIQLREEKSFRSEEVLEGVIVDFNKNGEIIGIEVLDIPEGSKLYSVLDDFVKKIKELVEVRGSIEGYLYGKDGVNNEGKVCVIYDVVCNVIKGSIEHEFNLQGKVNVFVENGKILVVVAEVVDEEKLKKIIEFLVDSWGISSDNVIVKTFGEDYG